MLLKKQAEVQKRLEKLESILRRLDCDSYKSETALTNVLAKRYSDETGDKMDGSTLRRQSSPYKLLVKSFFETGGRIKRLNQSEEHRRREELAIAKSKNYELGLQIKHLQKSLADALAQNDKFKLEDLKGRTDSASVNEDVYTTTEIEAFIAIRRLIKVGEDTSGFEITENKVTYLSRNFENKSVFTLVDCPKFFEWYRKTP